MLDFRLRYRLRGLNRLSPKPVWYETDGLRLRVFPGVWHPGRSAAARLLSRWVSRQSWGGRSTLELGCGPGLLALQVARAGGQALAVDREDAALYNLQENARRLNLSVAAFHSDLLAAVPPQPINCLLCVPPWYPAFPQQEADYDLCCGEAYEWFQLLMQQLPAYAHPQTQLLMALPASANAPAIKAVVARAGWRFTLLQQEPTASLYVGQPPDSSS